MSSLATSLQEASFKGLRPCPRLGEAKQSCPAELYGKFGAACTHLTLPGDLGWR